MMRLTVSGVLVVTTLMAVVGGMVQATSQKPPEPSTAILDQYDRVLNDLTLINLGEFGVTRIPKNPPEYHVGLRDELPKNGGVKTEFRATILRKINEGWKIEHGMFPPGYSARSVGKMNPVSIWVSTGTKESVLFGSHNRSEFKFNHELEQLALRTLTAIRNAPDRDFQSSVRGWTIRARAIRFRHRECLACHQTAKVNDIASIAAVAYRR